LLRILMFSRKLIQNEVLTFFFDIEKAYDTVSRNQVLKHLAEMGVRGNMFRYAEEFLKDRRFRVKISDQLSGEAVQEEGVPQGLSFSVQVFKVAMDQIQKFVGDCEMFLFADDIAFVFVLKGKKLPETRRKQIQKNLDELVRWAQSFGMKLSDKKSKIVKFTKRKSPIVLPSFKIGDKNISQVSETKFLGVIFDEKLTFRSHIDSTVEKASKDISILKFLGSNKLGVCRNSLLHVLNSKIRSKLEYGEMIMRNASQGQLRKLDVVYNRGLRVCLGAYRTTPVKSLYGEAGVLTLDARRRMSAQKFLVKVLGQRQHFLADALKKPLKRLNAAQLRRKNNKESNLRETYTELENRGVAEVKSTANHLSTPLWMKSNIKFDLDLHRKNGTVQTKDALPPEEWQDYARKKLEQYKNFTIRFTDGSKIEDQTGFAVVSKNGLIYSSRLANNTSVYTAEQMGIYHAASEPTSGNKVAIFTDSLSSILALMSRDDSNLSTLLFLNLMEELKKEIVLIWIPSHMGIPGNDRADREAKLAAESHIVFDPVYHVKDALNIIERCETDAAVQMWYSRHKFNIIKQSLAVPAKMKDVINFLKMISLYELM